MRSTRLKVIKNNSSVSKVLAIVTQQYFARTHQFYFYDALPDPLTLLNTFVHMEILITGHNIKSLGFLVNIQEYCWKIFCSLLNKTLYN